MSKDDRETLLSLIETVRNLAGYVLKNSMEINAARTAIAGVHAALHDTPELQDRIARHLKTAIEAHYAYALGTTQCDEMLAQHNESLSKLIPEQVWRHVRPVTA